MSSTQNSFASPPRQHRINDHNASTPSTSLSRHGPSQVDSSSYAEPESPISSVKKPRNAPNRTPSSMLAVQNTSQFYAKPLAQSQPSYSNYAKNPHTQKPLTGKPQGTPSGNLFSPQFDSKGPGQPGGSSGHHPVVSSETVLVQRPIDILQHLRVNTSLVETGIPHQYSPPCMKCITDLFIDGHLDTLKLKQLLACCMDEDNMLDPYFFIRDLQPLSTVVPVLRKSPLPVKQPDTPRITLALDLDETLAHSSTTHIDKPDFSFNVNFNGSIYAVYARIRPHLEHFLKQVSQWFEVVVFTASQKVYADSILNLIDPMNEYITHRVFRDSCVCVDKNYVKDLSILGRPLEHVIIVDNSIQAFGYHLNNGIPIESWFDDELDCELLNLIPFLRHLKDVDDVRPYLRDAFHLQQFVDSLPLDNRTHMGDR